MRRGGRQACRAPRSEATCGADNLKFAVKCPFGAGFQACFSDLTASGCPALALP